MRSLIFVTLLFFLGYTATSQSYNIGVRAGLNYSKFLGPLESNGSNTETLGFGGGFHFGLSYQYNLSDILGWRTELLYVQNGGTKRYSGPSYYILRTGNEAIFEKGIAEEYLLEVSNAYISLPVTLHFKPLKKWEFLGGAYLNISVGPNANGILDFKSTENPDDVFFKQTLRYNYYSDDPLETNFASAGSTIVYVNGDQALSVPKIAGAYYQYSEKDGNTYSTLDFGLLAGVNYYINPGFYFGTRLSYGLRDLTNDKMDFSISSFDEQQKSLITRDDRDTHLGLEFSLGFKF